MKQEIEINHDAETLTDAFGTTGEHVAGQLTKAVKKFIDDDRSKVSVLSEILHNDVDYKVILLLATQQVEMLAKKSAKATALKELLDLITED